jgi:hypothetical protein
VLFYSAGTDVELACNFLVAAALHEQVQDLLIAGRDFDLIEINHDLLLLRTWRSHSASQIARLSPIVRIPSPPLAKYFGA